ncbi:exodeoxyribonuclease III [Pseudoxanthomonas suwonensis]|uniref:exodeoxyribonuclease III n=1 Tax=Pseudoxanthomonas suwonensis TaxID=314722 RepID=UPI0004666408|nr:exodeoxyribonuclease III [Pseudoxanthomonas suwonensis]
MKIASWNVNSLNVRMPHLEQWLRAFNPDVVGLQETKLEDHKFPDTALAAMGYRSVFSGQKTYNGVAILSREEPRDVVIGVPGFDHEQKRAISATVGDVRIVNLYVVNGQDIGTPKYEFKLEWLAAVRAWLEQEIRTHPNLVVLGDFNIAPDERDVHDPAVWNDSHILTSAPERAALQDLLRVGLHDGFRVLHGDGGIFSWWDYRQAAFRRNLGLRIDLTLVSDALRPRVGAAGIDREPRTWERPSDHAPAWIELAG